MREVGIVGKKRNGVERSSEFVVRKCLCQDGYGMGMMQQEPTNTCVTLCISRYSIRLSLCRCLDDPLDLVML